MIVWILIMTVIQAYGGNLPSQGSSLSCDCGVSGGLKNCGTNPAFMSQPELEIARQLGFDVPGDNLKFPKSVQGTELVKAFVRFLEKSDRSRMFYPEFYTRATKDASILTLKSKYLPKNPTETDEYFRCSIPREKYCLYKSKLRPYIGLAAKASRIDYSFLACQSYVESRFKPDARSGAGAIGYSQIQPSNVEHMNATIKKSLRYQYQRRPASTPLSEKDVRINQVHDDIARIWAEFWKDTPDAPKKLCSNDLTCYRQSFLAQALSLKTDMLTLSTSSSGIKVDFDPEGNFLIENMDKGDSLLLLAGSYNVGVTRMIRLVSQFCHGSSKLKECLDEMKNGQYGDPEKDRARLRDVQAITNYVMRIRDCSQQYSAEQLDFDDDSRWSDAVRTEKQNQQRDRVAQCLLNPCGLPQNR